MTERTDTTTGAALRQRDAQRRVGAQGRLRIALDMSSFVRRLALERLRRQHPALSARELVHCLMRELHPRELAALRRDA